MREIAAALHAVALPDGFHCAAAAVYERLESYKDIPTPPGVTEAYRSLRS